MATKYQIGQKVTITGRRAVPHFLKMGSHCEIVKDYEDGDYELHGPNKSGDFIYQTVGAKDFKPVATPDRIPVSCSQGDSDYHEGQPTDNF